MESPSVHAKRPVRRVVITDGSQGAYLAWMDQRSLSTNGNDVYMQRVAATGNALWTAQGLGVATGPSNEQVPTLTSDAVNGAMVVFAAGSTTTDAGFWAQRLDNNGTPYWATTAYAFRRLLSGTRMNPRRSRMLPACDRWLVRVSRRFWNG